MAIQVPVSGQLVQLPSEVVSGAQLKEAAGIESGRLLIVWRMEGAKLVRDEERIQVLPDDYFDDAPNWRYG